MRASGGAAGSSTCGISYTTDVYGDCDEKEFIQLLERKFPKNIILKYRIEDHGGFVNSAYEQIHAIEEPFVDYLWPVSQKIYQLAKAQGADVLLTGHWGDQFLFSLDYLLDLLERGQIFKIFRHLREYSNWCGKGEYQFYRNYFLREALKMGLPEPLIYLSVKLKKISINTSTKVLNPFYLTAR